MGYMTLADFTSDVVSALGANYNNSLRLARWVNAGYLDLLTSLDFEETNEEVEITTDVATQTIDVPTGALLVESIRNETSDINLGWIPKTEMLRRSVDSIGVPTHWCRFGDVVRLHPLPDDAYILTMFYKASPDLLDVDTDTTMLPDMWDPVVSMLATHHAFLGLGQEARSAVWLGRAITYIQSRVTDGDFMDSKLGLASSVGLDKLNQRLQSLGGAET